jgi:hypothetical protein
MSWHPPPPPPPVGPPPGWSALPRRPSGPRTWVPGLLTGAAVTLLPSLASVAGGPTALLVVSGASLLLLGPAALLVGTVLICIEATRNFGIGLLISTAVALIMLAGLCIGALSWSSSP